MNKAHVQLQKLALAAILTSVSIVIDVFFKQLIGIANFGVPFYAIPIVFGSIVLGPLYGLLMSLISDGIGVTISGYGYLLSFALAPIMWGIIPGLFLYRRYNITKLAFVIPLTYIFANLSNTLAMFIEFGRETTLATMVLRMTFIPINSILIFFIVKDLYTRLHPFHEKFQMTPIKSM